MQRCECCKYASTHPPTKSDPKDPSMPAIGHCGSCGPGGERCGAVKDGRAKKKCDGSLKSDAQPAETMPAPHDGPVAY